MPRLIILIAVIAIALILWHKIRNARGAERKKMIMWSILSAVIGILLILAVTGHLNIITAAIAGAVAMIPRVLPLLRHIPLFARYFQPPGSQQPGGNQQTAARNGQMDRDEAMEVLGLKPGFTREDVIQAHRRMMQKVHPDRGGSDYLAAQINRAKDVLLG